LEGIPATYNFPGLYTFYISLPPEEKLLFNRYGVNKDFPIPNLARLLWITAANLLPQGQHVMAEKLLHKALTLTGDKQELGHIHANLAQLYADIAADDPSAAAKCRHHCEQTISTGYFVPWATRLLNTLG